MGQTQITKLEVMPVSLAIGRNVDQISTRRRADKLLHESTARREGSLESDRAREWSIVEENCERATRSIRMTEEIRLGSVDYVLSLVWREDDVTHALFDEEREHLIVRSSLR